MGRAWLGQEGAAGVGVDVVEGLWVADRKRL